MGATAAARARARVRLPLLVAGGAAWLVLAVRPAGHVPADSGGATHPHGSAHAIHSAHPVDAEGGALPLAADAVLMFAAMMLPLAAPPVRHVRERSFARRRWRAVALFLAGYGLPWIAAGAALVALAGWIAAAGWPVAALAVGLVAAFQASPLKQRCLNHCHGHPQLAAFGARADLDALRFGLRHALWCIGACAALMLLPMLVPRFHLAAMAAVTLWIAGERLESPSAPRWRLRVPAKAVRILLARAAAWRANGMRTILPCPRPIARSGIEGA